jgi:hypothetical protein
VKRLALLLSLAVLAGCGGGSAQKVPPGAAAVVDGHVITKAAVVAELGNTRRVYRAQSKAFPARGTKAYEQLLGDAAALLADREHLETEAERLGIRIGPAQVDAALRQLKQTKFGGNEAAFREQLQSTGLTELAVRQALRDRLLASAIRGRAKPAEVTFAPGFEPGGSD